MSVIFGRWEFRCRRSFVFWAHHRRYKIVPCCANEGLKFSSPVHWKLVNLSQYLPIVTWCPFWHSKMLGPHPDTGNMRSPHALLIRSFFPLIAFVLLNWLFSGVTHISFLCYTVQDPKELLNRWSSVTIRLWCPWATRGALPFLFLLTFMSLRSCAAMYLCLCYSMLVKCFFVVRIIVYYTVKLEASNHLSFKLSQ